VKTLFDKLWDLHLVTDLGGGTGLIAVDRILLHERTGGVALKSIEAAGYAVHDPSRVFVTMDHIVDTFPGRSDDTLMPSGKAFITETRAAAHRNGLTLFDLDDPRQGIVHIISPEQGIVIPGATLVCPDSHTCSQGALGALAWGIGSSEAEHALVTGTLRVKRPQQMRISVDGRLRDGVTAKDLALAIVARIGSAGAKGHMIEYAGSAIEALSIEERLTLCNMATELSAFSAIIAPDDTTCAYVQGRPYAPTDHWDAAVAHWRTLASDPDATFDFEHRFDAAEIVPMISWGTNPEQSLPPSTATVPATQSDQLDRARDYMGLAPGTPLAGLPIDVAFIGSCTNARLSDLRRAAAILDGHHVAPGVKAICVPGSTQVKAAAEAEGLDRIFRAAGFEWREAGCSMCFFAGGESFGPQQRVVTSTNRNFESRQGPGTRSHLASPETVAASAVLGRIATREMLESLR
jgi:3-isopropylmalate/(R)-2-methylmalate dehydratase large subunit